MRVATVQLRTAYAVTLEWVIGPALQFTALAWSARCALRLTVVGLN